ncbi:MAG TPA: hypothetical protein PLO64_01990 [Methanothermobacter sp.]|nr:conserved hypothetical protein [Methanothermobacter sp. MT-2]HHW05491.1 hypothetical protein [Methanothermobacter sp.]HOK72592.1 hypothetical protein [Methanothermobacter sp.]HOL68688.1 hypothetical protein [Methanothermobacter sp.]HPQ04447.1 hypothetical protein [Methanothermobacter sp.]
MELVWFYIAVFLAISDELHTRILWKTFMDFYIILAGIIREAVSSNIQLWLIHEGLEALFHFIILSIVFLSVEIGLLAALIHLIVDVYHQITGVEHGWLYHRALHFTIESLFFILILS